MIPFNKPFITGNELRYISDAHNRGQLAGDGYYTKLCSTWIEQHTGSKKVLLTHSCTAALEMAAILSDISPGDEVIMPSYTFVSTANAFVLRGAVPIFVDIRADTLNIDERLIEQAITEKTKVIVPVHYSGVACEMDTIMDIANKHNIIVIEDAAQGIMSNYKGRPLGSIGHLGCFSFHETKNVVSGEGGALLINDERFIDRAEIIREKGTNRTQFFRGQIDKYNWVDIGSSYLPGEIISAFLWAQIEKAETITHSRLNIWNDYHDAFEDLEGFGLLRRPIIPEDVTHNGHMYYLLLSDLDARSSFIKLMSEDGIHCVFHYVPLHSSPEGKKRGHAFGTLPITSDIADRLVRLPLWPDMKKHQPEIIRKAKRILKVK